MVLEHGLLPPVTNFAGSKRGGREAKARNGT